MSEPAEPEGDLHPDASNHVVEAPPLDGPPKPFPKRKAGGGGSASGSVTISSCAGVEVPDDPTWDPKARH